MPKFRRKKIVEIEAYYLMNGEYGSLPGYVRKFIILSNELRPFDAVKTASGAICLAFPTWIVLEQNNEGAYPVSPEYFAENFEEVTSQRGFDNKTRTDR